MLYLSTRGLSIGQIAKILSMSKTTVYRWITNFAEENAKEMSASTKINKGLTEPPPNDIQELSQSNQGNKTTDLTSQLESESAEQKIVRLERELREARLRADFYEEMINVAETKFDIQIRKKAGVKR